MGEASGIWFGGGVGVRIALVTPPLPNPCTEVSDGRPQFFPSLLPFYTQQRELSLVLWDDLEEWEEQCGWEEGPKQKGDIYI